IEQLKRQSEQSGGVLAYLQLFSGAGLTNFAVFALGVMPYITSSIIMQILTVVIPKLEEWHQQGAIGQRKITQWTRYLTVSIAVLQSTELAFLFHNGGGSLHGWASNPTKIDVLPYITRWIVMQIHPVVIPKLEEWQQQGAIGKRKTTQRTRYLNVAIAVLQSTELAFLYHHAGGGLLGRESNPTNTDVLPEFTPP